MSSMYRHRKRRYRHRKKRLCQLERGSYQPL